MGVNMRRYATQQLKSMMRGSPLAEPPMVIADILRQLAQRDPDRFNATAIIDVQSVPSVYADATHRVYRIRTAQGDYALKVVDNVQSPFWLGVAAIFASNVSCQWQVGAVYYQRWTQVTQLATPHLVVSGCLPNHVAYGVSEWLQGRMLGQLSYDQRNWAIMLLAKDAYYRQTQAQPTWGSLLHDQRSADEWHLGVNAYLRQAQIDTPELPAYTGLFVPQVLDMRWDQLLALVDGQLALVDGDAIVFAPWALELTWLEYWLTSSELVIWCRSYQQLAGEVPRLSVRDRHVYRHLLWQWQVLGEIPLNRWLAQPCYFADDSALANADNHRSPVSDS